jgi:septum formation protein
MEQNEMTFSQLGRPILLASASPRRRELLTALGLDFTVKVSHADESVPEGTPSREAVELVARRKAAAVAEGADPDTIVIAADTTVDLEGEALGKPRDDADAARMLRALSGRAHSVFTGVAVAYRGQMLSSSDATAVLFRPLTEEEIATGVAILERMRQTAAAWMENH